LPRICAPASATRPRTAGRQHPSERRVSGHRSRGAPTAAGGRLHRWRRQVAAIALLAATLVAAPAPAAETAAPAPRPKLCLALSGGGARGYAHLGVLRVFEANHIPIDCIAGTSMGAVVGGLYASGFVADDLIAKLEKVDLTNIAFDRNERSGIAQALREDEVAYPIGLSAGYGDGRIKLPTGLVQGNRFLILLQDWTSEQAGNIAFDRLPIPFRAVATDLRNGDEVILDHGSLPHAIRGSMAAPGLFAPIAIDGRTLVDGGLVANLPVHVARDLGADVVVAVDIGSPLLKEEDIHSPLAVTSQMLGILVAQNVRAQKALLRPGDVLISPALGDLSFADFSHAASAIAAGEEAARAALPALRRYALEPAAWASFRGAQLARAAPRRPRIDRIEIVTSAHVSPDYVRRFVAVREGDLYDPDKLRDEMQAIATSGYFDSVTHELIEADGKTTLRVEANEASWGPHLFLFGLNLSSDFNGAGAFRFSLGHRLPWINASGLEWRNDIVLGSDITRVETELRQPLTGPGGTYIAPYASFSQQNQSIYLNDLFEKQPANPLPFANYRLTTTRVGTDIGMPLGRLGELRAGLEYAEFVDRPRTFIPADFVGLEGTDNFLPVARSRLFGPRVRLVLDQLDDALYPRRGYYLLAENETSLLQGGQRYSESHVKGLWAASIGRHSFNVALEAGGDFGAGDSAQPPGFYLGGFQHLSAYPPDQFAGNFVLYGRVTYLTPIAAFDAPPFRNLFLGLSAEAGNVWIREGDYGNGSFRQSYSAFLGMTSSFGPLYFGVAAAPSVFNVYFQLGRPF
jgi:NTE family protein